MANYDVALHTDTAPMPGAAADRSPPRARDSVEGTRRGRGARRRPPAGAPGADGRDHGGGDGYPHVDEHPFLRGVG